MLSSAHPPQPNSSARRTCQKKVLQASLYGSCLRSFSVSGMNAHLLLSSLFMCRAPGHKQDAPQGEEPLLSPPLGVPGGDSKLELDFAAVSTASLVVQQPVVEIVPSNGSPDHDDPKLLKKAQKQKMKEEKRRQKEEKKAEKKAKKEKGLQGVRSRRGYAVSGPEICIVRRDTAPPSPRSESAPGTLNVSSEVKSRSAEIERKDPKSKTASSESERSLSTSGSTLTTELPSDGEYYTYEELKKNETKAKLNRTQLEVQPHPAPTPNHACTTLMCPLSSGILHRTSSLRCLG